MSHTRCCRGQTPDAKTQWSREASTRIRALVDTLRRLILLPKSPLVHTQRIGTTFHLHGTVQQMETPVVKHHVRTQ